VNTARNTTTIATDINSLLLVIPFNKLGSEKFPISIVNESGENRLILSAQSRQQYIDLNKVAPAIKPTAPPIKPPVTSTIIIRHCRRTTLETVKKKGIKIVLGFNTIRKPNSNPEARCARNTRDRVNILFGQLNDGAIKAIAAANIPNWMRVKFELNESIRLGVKLISTIYNAMPLLTP
jgi:hypothetical protein